MNFNRLAPFGTAIRASGYQEVDIRILEHWVELIALAWCPHFPILCPLISWSPDARFTEVE
jgi:hypothetical protein